MPSSIETSRRRLVVAGATLLGAVPLAARRAHAQADWPTKPIRMILPYTGGGSADALARAVAEQLHQRFGQPVVVESRPGANSMLGAEMVARAPADGYTLLYCGWPTIGTNTVMYRKVGYKLEDFQPLTMMFRTPIGLVAKKDFPANNLRELMDYARKQGALSYGTSGNGSSPHMLLARLRAATGVPLEHVPYKGEGPPVLDVLGGHLPVFAGSLATPQQHLRAGTLKVIAHSGAERIPAFPDAPTFKEAGFTEHVFTYWHGIAAPAGTPRPIVEKLHAAIVAAMNTDKVRSVMGADQIVTTSSTPEAFTEVIRKEIEVWGPVIKANNMVE